MAYTYPLTLPTVTGLARITLRAVSAVGLSTSPFTFKQQAVKFSGQRWEADISLPPMKRAAAEEWIAFLLRLNGHEGRFLLGDPSGATARGSASTTAGTPLSNGTGVQTGSNPTTYAGQVGSAIDVDGMPASATGYLKQGDYIQFGAAGGATLHKVLTDVDTNASGEASIDIWPYARGIQDNTAMTVASCVGQFRLNSNQQNWDVNQAQTFGINFTAVEVVQ